MARSGRSAAGGIDSGADFPSGRRCGGCGSRSTIRNPVHFRRATRSPQFDAVSTIAARWPSSRTWAAVVVANTLMTRAIAPVQPVWWLAPIPAPLSPWKYS